MRSVAALQSVNVEAALGELDWYNIFVDMCIIASTSMELKTPALNCWLIWSTIRRMYCRCISFAIASWTRLTFLAFKFELQHVTQKANGCSSSAIGNGRIRNWRRVVWHRNRREATFESCGNKLLSKVWVVDVEQVRQWHEHYQFFKIFACFDVLLKWDSHHCKLNKMSNLANSCCLTRARQ